MANRRCELCLPLVETRAQRRAGFLRRGELTLELLDPLALEIHMALALVLDLLPDLLDLRATAGVECVEALPLLLHLAGLGYVSLATQFFELHGLTLLLRFTLVSLLIFLPAVLMGGTSSERAVSLVSGTAVLEALRDDADGRGPREVRRIEIEEDGRWNAGDGARGLSDVLAGQSTLDDAMTARSLNS